MLMTQVHAADLTAKLQSYLDCSHWNEAKTSNIDLIPDASKTRQENTVAYLFSNSFRNVTPKVDEDDIGEAAFYIFKAKNSHSQIKNVTINDYGGAGFRFAATYTGNIQDHLNLHRKNGVRFVHFNREQIKKNDNKIMVAAFEEVQEQNVYAKELYQAKYKNEHGWTHYVGVFPSATDPKNYVVACGLGEDYSTVN